MFDRDEFVKDVNDYLEDNYGEDPLEKHEEEEAVESALESGNYSIKDIAEHILDIRWEI